MQVKNYIVPLPKGHVAKILLGLMGLTWGLKGGILGAFLGWAIDSWWAERNSPPQDAAFDAYRRQQGKFVFHVFSLCAKVAKAKGAIGRSEIQYMKKLMNHEFRMNPENQKYAQDVWKKAKDSPVPFEQYARRFFEDFRLQRHHVYNMMDLLFAITAVNGRIDPRQETLLLQAAGIFQISRLQYNRIKQRYFFVQPTPAWNPLDPHYAILGASPSETMDSIKTKFRKLALQYHPDKMMAKGASEQAIKHAQKKFQELNEAYEAIKAARQI